MPKTRINCPNCRQPISAEIDQLFDAGTDPQAKQRLLSGAFNLARCPHCGFAGNLASPIVYHDPDKELLLTFVPAELGLKMDDQERIIGPLINKVVNSLPQEKRKGYLLRPQAMFTLQALIERILEGDGITKEMLQAQQQRLNLLNRLATVTSEDVLAEIVKQEEKLMDAEFFGILGQVIQAAMMGNDQNAARHLSELSKKLLPLTEFGRQALAQRQEMDAALQSLRALGDQLDREKLLDIVIQAPNALRLEALVGLARPGMDYVFFQTLSERIEHAQGEEKKPLADLREQLLKLTREVDLQMEARTGEARKVLETVLASEEVEQAMAEHSPVVDDFFLRALNTVMAEARQKGDLERIGKLQKIVQMIEAASAPPAELSLIEELLEAPDEAAMQKMLEEHVQEITPQFVEMLTSILAQPQATQDAELNNRLQMLYKLVIRMSMQVNLKP